MTQPDGNAVAVSRIAVLRANGIGDFVFALPALDAIRAAHPSAEIVLLGLEWHERLLSERPGPIDRVVTVPSWPGVRDDGVPDWLEQETFFARMAEERFDLAMQMHGGGANSNPFVARLGARRTVGLRTPESAQLDAWIPYRYFQSEVQRCLEVASLAGARPLGSYPHLCVTAADLAEAGSVLPDDPRPTVALNPGAGDGRRRWPTACFAEVGRRLTQAGARVVVTGGEEDVERAAEIAEATPEASAIAGRISLGGMLGVFSRCALVVSNDSGPLHLAEAVGAPTVGLYWCGNVINAGAPTRLRNRVLMSWRLACPVCGVDCMSGSCDHDASFVADIPVDDVAAEALDLLSRAARHPAAAQPVLAAR